MDDFWRVNTLQNREYGQTAWLSHFCHTLQISTFIGGILKMKAIETHYNGYKFRSRLEARWAVFFDAAGIEYQYEPEGFVIEPCYGEDSAYLPDFYLPKFDIYAEVKGSDEQLKKDSGKIMDAIDFMQTPMSEKGLILLGDIPYKNPNEEKIPLFYMLSWHKGVVTGYCTFVYFFKSRAPHAFLQSATDFREGEYWLGYSNYWNGEMLIPTSVRCNWIDVEKADQSIDVARTMAPYEKARQARFEHGETPEA